MTACLPCHIQLALTFLKVSRALRGFEGMVRAYGQTPGWSIHGSNRGALCGTFPTSRDEIKFHLDYRLLVSRLILPFLDRSSEGIQ